MSELISTIVEAKKVIFIEISLIKSDISFAKDNQYIILHLKKSKTYMKQTGMQIILVIINKQMYPIVTLKRLFI